MNSPKGERRVVEPVVGSYDIPARALAAYQRAADLMADDAPRCRLPWTLLAAIGKVESNHGRYGRASLGSDGVSRPSILGLPLNGVGPVARIGDTDGGRLDGDPVWDRAVGPMQFIPSTWAFSAADGDGDGVANPHDIDDAALAAGEYLCAGSSNITEPDNMKRAIFRYNRSWSYVALVMAYELGYRTGDFRISEGGGSSPPAEDRAPTVVAAPPAEMGVDAVRPVASADQPGEGSAAPNTPAPSPPTGQPSPAPSPSEPAPSASEPASTPSEPAPTPSEPAPTPSEPSGPAEPAPPEPTTPEPDTAPSPENATGVWEECDAGYCLDGTPLDVGPPDLMDEVVADYDGDGTTEDVAAELAGLVGHTVSVLVTKEPERWVIVAINDLDYPV